MTFNVKDRRSESDDVLRQCQLTQLYLLEILDAVCKAHGIVYYLEFGTLLGAIRHNGFIPWDDDLDIGMPHKDYVKFLKLAPKELPDGVLIQTPSTNAGYNAPLSRLRDCRSFYAESRSRIDAPSGIFVDIYEIKRAPRHFRRIHRICHKIIGLAWCSACIHRTMPSYTIRGIFVRWLKGVTWQTILTIFAVVDAALRIFGTDGWKHHPALSRWPYRPIDDDVLFPLEKHSFEGQQFPVPHKSRELLDLYYGDWQQLPPVADRNPRLKMKLVLPTQAPDEWWAAN